MRFVPQHILYGFSASYRVDEKELGISVSTNQTIFGSDDADAIEGGALIDHLYGDESNDTLTGNGGNDYLEGGLGDDTYIINEADGVDTLLDIDG
ncbi:calcium-binding protein, partial [Methylocucumis oryzae]